MSWKLWAGAASAVGGVVAVAAALPLLTNSRRSGGGDEAVLTLEQLRKLAPRLSAERAAEYLPHLRAAMADADITTPLRKSAFLATLMHESYQLTRWLEVATGEAYEGRENLGNTQPGDGPRYKGRGPIQLTGRYNYRTAGKALGVDLEGNPSLAKSVDVGFRVAGWYWKSRKLNPFADVGDFREVTRRVNGGYNGWEDRERYYRQALQLFGAGSS